MHHILSTPYTIHFKDLSLVSNIDIFREYERKIELILTDFDETNFVLLIINHYMYKVFGFSNSLEFEEKILKSLISGIVQTNGFELQVALEVIF